MTPSFTGVRLPDGLDLLRVLRYTAGWWLVAGELLWLVARGRSLWSGGQRLGELFTVVFVANGVAIIASLTILNSLNVWVAAYAQVLTVGLWLAGRSGSFRGWRSLWILALMVGGLRALGLTTWGVAGAQDVSQAEAAARVRAAVHAMPADSAVMISSCFLYAVADERERALYHADWTRGIDARPDGRSLNLLIYSSLDYHRRFDAELQELVAAGRVQVMKFDARRTLPIPEDFPPIRRFFSHLSWTPVIIWVEWPESDAQ